MLISITLYTGPDFRIPKPSGPAIIIHEFPPINGELLEYKALPKSSIHTQCLPLVHYRCSKVFFKIIVTESVWQMGIHSPENSKSNIFYSFSFLVVR